VGYFNYRKRINYNPTFCVHAEEKIEENMSNIILRRAQIRESKKFTSNYG